MATDTSPDSQYTVAIKSIRRSQVTGLLNLTKSHRGHTKIAKKFEKSPKRATLAYKCHQKFLISVEIFKAGNLSKIGLYL